MYIAVAEQQGIPAGKLSGNGAERRAQRVCGAGTYIFPLRESLRLSADIIAYCAEDVPKWNPISISGYHMREAGSTAAEEVAFCLSNGFAYLEAVAGRGIPWTASPRVLLLQRGQPAFRGSSEVPRARRIRARTLREKYGSQDPRAQM